jgi:carboxyl-terminal processing protease
VHNQQHYLPLRKYLQRAIPPISLVFVVTIVFLAGHMTGLSSASAQAAPAMQSQVERPEEFGVFWEAWDLVQEYFVDREKIDETEMTYGAIRGMLATLKDENHTAFMTPDEAAQEASDMEGSFEGIGAYVDLKDDQFLIVAPIHGSPAEAAGVLAGDIILAVDGNDIAGQNEQEVISQIRGPAGTEVTLTVLHPEAEEPVDILITRGTINIESVTWGPVPETNYVYIKISQFVADTSDEMLKTIDAIDEYAAAGNQVDGILLDLRNNPGGYLSQVIDVSGQFINRGDVILYQRDATGESQAYRAMGRGRLREYPIVALTNEGTASAGEILAGALQENERALLVGEVTLGTGTVLQPFTLSDGSVLRLGVTNWLTPKQRLIKDQGVAPDIEIAQEASVLMVDNYAMEGKTLDEILAEGDLQFNRALEELRMRAGEPVPVQLEGAEANTVTE